MLNTRLQERTERLGELTACAQCGAAILAPTWSEHVDERCVRHVWECEACGYEFETAVYFQAKAATAPHPGSDLS
jgi:ribosomal protein L37AE/L43A